MGKEITIMYKNNNLTFYSIDAMKSFIAEQHGIQPFQVTIENNGDIILTNKFKETFAVVGYIINL